MEIADEKFWLEYGKTAIKNSISSENAAADKLGKLTIWFWGVYTPAFALGASLSTFDEHLVVLILFAAPIPLMIITYWFCTLAQMPITQSFDPRFPLMIKDAHNASVTRKKKRFRIALILTFISAILVSSASVSLSFSKQKKEDVKVVHAMDVSFDKVNSAVSVSGLFPVGTLVVTEFDTLMSDSSRHIFYHEQFTIQENGLLHHVVPIGDSVHNTIRISTFWSDGKVEKGIVKEMKLK